MQPGITILIADNAGQGSVVIWVKPRSLLRQVPVSQSSDSSSESQSNFYFGISFVIKYIIPLEMQTARSRSSQFKKSANKSSKPPLEPPKLFSSIDALYMKLSSMQSSIDQPPLLAK